MSFDKYQFLSWSRRGIAADIAEADTLGKTPGAAKERATVPVSVKINTDITENKNFTLIGPGDITGVQSAMIVRTEPRNGISDFEPNLLAGIEFYDEDFPWRYTPASATGPDKLHLRPWLALIVLREDEFQDTPRRTPLPSVKVLNPDALPPHDELHLWAHMHSNLPNSETALEKFIESLGEAAKTDPDGVYSRLLCPRKLTPKVLYHAFLVPSYETGRLAGLGMSTKDIPAQKPSWPGPDLELPYYYRWHFRTSENFDFEYLVKLLEPRVMDKRVGTRPMDCSAPGFVQADALAPVSAPEPKVLLLEGALKAPTAESTPYPPAAPQDFLTQLEKLVNLNRAQVENPNEDPIVTVPFYGMYHAQQKDPANPGGKLLPVFKFNSDAWANDLNRDPRNRVPAGFGLRVVQENQDRFMDSAWKQLGDVLEANRRALLIQFHTRVAERAFAKTFGIIAANPEQLLNMTRSLSARVLFDKTTVRNHVAESLLPEAVFTSAFRRITRQQTSLMRNIGSGQRAQYSYPALVKSMNFAEGLKAAPVGNFAVFPQISAATAFKPPQTLESIKVWSFNSNLDKGSVFNFTGFKGGLPNIIKWTSPFSGNIFTGGIKPVNPTGGGGILVNPTGGGGILVNPTGGGGIVVNPTGGTVINPTGGLNISEEVIKPRGPEDFKTAYLNLNVRFSAVDQPVAQPALAVQALATQTLAVLEPVQAYRKYFDARVKWPANMLRVPQEDFLPAMAYPDIPEPAYKYLVDIDKELLLPNLELIPQNTLSLLRTNQKFIESYLTGLNYEMGRELLWREYPTDMRGSYFRQFWDVNGLITPDAKSPDAEKLKDIKPIHRWASASKLGSHNARDAEGDAEQLVFVIRGDLLKKFPNTVIFAQKTFIVGGKKVINASPTNTEILFPQYQADLPPDIKLLGFDLTIEQAAGAMPGKGFTDTNGWFFILAEVPGEPRFGMDITYNPNKPAGPFKWNDLSWENFGGQQIPFIKAGVLPGNASPAKPFTRPAVPTEGIWGKSAADMAAILLQRPVMMAVHATEMLDIEVPDTNAEFGRVTKLRAQWRGTPVAQIKWISGDI